MQKETTAFKLSRKVARKNFVGSERLFKYCWWKYCSFLKGSIDDPTCQADVDGWLNSIASEKVNDSNSSFFMYGE